MTCDTVHVALSIEQLIAPVVLDCQVGSIV